MQDDLGAFLQIDGRQRERDRESLEGPGEDRGRRTEQGGPPEQPAGDEPAREAKAPGDVFDLSRRHSTGAQSPDQAAHAAARNEVWSDPLPLEDLQDADVRETPRRTAS